MTGEQINRRIADLLGWNTRRTETGIGMKWELIDPDDGPVYVRLGAPHQHSVSSWFDTEDLAWQRLPNWSNSVEDALALCSEIAREKSYGIHIDPLPLHDNWESDTYAAFWTGGVAYSAVGDGEAEALARLALAALEAQANTVT